MHKRICLIRQAIYPYELSVRREAETLCQEGFETHVISLGSPSQGTLPREETINGVRVHRVPLTRKKTTTVRYLYDYLSFFLWAGLLVTRLHLRHPFAAIQVTTMPDFLVFATLIPKVSGAKTVVMMQEPVPELWQAIRNRPAPPILKVMERAALAYVDAAFTVTQQLKGLYVSRGADPRKISVVLVVPEGSLMKSNGVQEGKTSTDEQQFTLICHGAIEERYGHDTMLDAVALVKSQVPGLRLRILGRGSYVDRFLAQRNLLGLQDCVDYLGWVEQSEMIRELRAADVGIVAQKSSAYSNLVHTNKLFDYLHFGKPVLHSRLKAVEAYFDDQSLWFFEPGDAESLAAGILELYEHPAKRQMLAENSRRLYDEYQWERQREVYLSVYRDLLR